MGVTKTIDKNWHTPMTELGIKPRECKHLRIGRVEGAGMFEVFLFLPNLPLNRTAGGGGGRRGPKVEDSRAQCYLRAEEQARWIDEAFLPAMRQVYGDDTLQHHPRSFREAANRSRARQKETVSGKDRGFTEQAYFLPPTLGRDRARGAARRQPPLQRLWRRVLDGLADMGPEWADARLIALTYDCKLQYRSATLAELQASVQANLARTFDLEHCDLQAAFVDLAYEDTAERPPGQADGGGLVLLRRSACNQHDLDQLAPGANTVMYNWQGTADCSSVTAEPMVKSAVRRGGMAYMQAYNSIKDMFASIDKARTFMFADPAFTSLAFTREALEGLSKADRRKNHFRDRHDRARSLLAFKAVTRRIHEALEDNADCDTGFGCRQEYRISWATFLALRAPSTAGQGSGSTSTSTVARGAHLPYYVLDKEEVLRYIRWETNRWLHAACAVLGKNNGVVKGLPLEEQHANAAMLKALLPVLDLSISNGFVLRRSRLARETYRVGVNAGTQDEERDDRPVRRGLDLLRQMQRHNVFWLPSNLFDWERLAFRPSELEATAFATTIYLERFGTNGLGDREERFHRCVDARLAGYARCLAEGATEARRLAALQDLEQTCYQLVFHAYSHWLLQTLLKAKRLPGHEDEDQGSGSIHVGPDELGGEWGLSYDLIWRLGGREPRITRPQHGKAPYTEGKGEGKRAPLGGYWMGGRNDWVSRIETLFKGVDMGFDNHPYRRWANHCRSRLESLLGREMADGWWRDLGVNGTRWLTVLPKYERNKPYQWWRPKGFTAYQQRDQPQTLEWTAALPLDFQPDDVRWHLGFYKGRKGLKGPRPTKRAELQWELLSNTKGFRLVDNLKWLRHHEPWARGSIGSMS